MFNSTQAILLLALKTTTRLFESGAYWRAVLMRKRGLLESGVYWRKGLLERGFIGERVLHIKLPSGLIQPR